MSSPAGLAIGRILERRARDLQRDLLVTEGMFRRIEAVLRERVSNRIQSWIAEARGDADGLRRALADGTDDEAAMWARVHALRTSIDQLIEELLRLVAGATLRSSGLDDGYCDLADALIDELVLHTPVEHWGSFTILGRSERYSRASRVIEVRGPNTAIWELPVVVHELGHFIGPALFQEGAWQSVHPLDAIFAKYGDGTAESWSWMQELFADAFAAYALGPAYGYTCAVEVFDPLFAHIPTATHPPLEQRVQVIVATLRLAGSDMEECATEIEQLWTQLVTESGGDDGVSPAGESPYFGPVTGLVGEHLQVAQWTGWAAAGDVMAHLTSSTPGPAPAATIADILNGAWFVRRTLPSTTAVDKVGQRAVALIRRHLGDS